MRRNPEACCGNCAYYIPVDEEKRTGSECRRRRPTPLLVPVMVPIEGSPILVPGKNGQSGPPMRQIWQPVFPHFGPFPDFWCGEHPGFWMTDDD